MTVNIILNDATPSTLPDFVRTNNAATTHSDLEAVAQAVARARRIVVVCGRSQWFHSKSKVPNLSLCFAK